MGDEYGSPEAAQGNWPLTLACAAMTVVMIVGLIWFISASNDRAKDYCAKRGAVVTRVGNGAVCVTPDGRIAP